MLDRYKILLASLMMVVLMCPMANLEAASLSFYTKTKNYKLGETFSTSFYLASLDKSVNAMSATLIYPTKMLELVDVSTAGTESRFWIEQPKVENTGAVKVQWLILNPGYTGKGAKVLTLTFKAKAVGSAPVFVKDVQVLANDGKATPVKTSASGILFAITRFGLAPKAVLGVSVRSSSRDAESSLGAREDVLAMPEAFVLNSATHPLQNTWYHGEQAQLNWNLPSGTEAVSYSLDKFTDTVPVASGDGKNTFVTYKNLSDGVFYFHIRLKLARGWTGAAHYRLNVDHSSPSLAVSIWQDKPSDLPILKYGASDASSGIDHYEISFDNGQAKRFDKAGALMLSNVAKGPHVLRVVVYDRAGNQAGDSKSFDYQPELDKFIK